MQQALYFLPLPQGQGAFRPTRPDGVGRGVGERASTFADGRGGLPVMQKSTNRPRSASRDRSSSAKNTLIRAEESLLDDRAAGRMGIVPLDFTCRRLSHSSAAQVSLNANS